MKYTAEEVLDILAQDEILHPSNRPLDEIADLHSVLADMVVDEKIMLAFDEDNRPMFKRMIPIRIPLTLTKEMLN